MNDLDVPQQSGGAGIPKVFLALLSGAVVALVASNIFLFTQVEGIRSEMAKMHQATQAEMGSIREAASTSTAAARKHLDSLREELESARRQATVAVGQAKTEALSRAEQLSKQLAEEQRRQQQQVASQLSEVKEAATATTARLGEVSSDLTNVKTEVATTKSDLDRTISDLKRVTGDLGVMSGLIATNGKELSALKALGDRNYFEFDLKKQRQPHRIGDIGITVKNVNVKRNRYTVELLADDKRVEKKDKNVNEPVQFYVSKARQPYELVVNEVKKNQIIGYLATPKVQSAR